MSFAFVFPGQGSQSVGMMDAWSGHPAAMQVIAEASAALGEDLGALMAQGPAEQLSLTTNTQPAMLTAGVAMFEAWRAAGGPQASLMAGHSLGEYAALTAAGALSLADAVRIVRVRADAMQAAVPVGTGAMAAVLGLEDDAVRAACAEAAQGQVVEAVNFNAPSQVVIAGHADAGITNHQSHQRPTADRVLAGLCGADADRCAGARVLVGVGEHVFDHLAGFAAVGLTGQWRQCHPRRGPRWRG